MNILLMVGRCASIVNIHLAVSRVYSFVLDSVERA